MKRNVFEMVYLLDFETSKTFAFPKIRSRNSNPIYTKPKIKYSQREYSLSPTFENSDSKHMSLARFELTLKV